MGQFLTEFIMGLQTNNTNSLGNNSPLSAYPNNALCNLIEFSEQQFLREEINAASAGAVVSNNNSSSSVIAAAAAAAAAHHQQLIQQQNLHQLQQQQLQQRYQQHFLQNVSPSLNLSQHNLTKGLVSQLTTPGSNCSSPDAISQLSGTIKSDDHSNHSYVSDATIRELPEKLLNKYSTELNSSNLALVQKSMKNSTKKQTYLNNKELKFSVKSILSDDNQQFNNLLDSTSSKPKKQNVPIYSNNNLNLEIDEIKCEKTENGYLDKKKGEKNCDSNLLSNTQTLKNKGSISNNSSIKSNDTIITSSALSSSSTSSSTSSSPQPNQQQSQIDHQVNFNQQAAKTIERRFVEKDLLKKDDTFDYSNALVHYSSLLPNVDLELLRNQNLAQLHHSPAYPIKPSAHYAINLLRNSLANVLIPNSANNFSTNSNDCSFPILSNHSSNPLASLNNLGNNSISTSLQNKMTSSSANDLIKESVINKQKNDSLRQSSTDFINSGQSINNNLSNNTTSHNYNSNSPSISNRSASSHSHHLNSNNNSQVTPLSYPLSTLAWMSSARGKPRRGMMRRAVFSDAQRQGLEKRFQFTKYISKPDRKKLADDLGLKDSQVKIWFQNRRMKWRNSKERELLSHGGSREQTLPTKNNPNPDLTDVGTELLNGEKLRNSSLTVQQLKQQKQEAALSGLSMINDSNIERDADADEIDIEGYSDTESQGSSYDKMYVADSPMSILDSPINEDEYEEDENQIEKPINKSKKTNKNTCFKQESLVNRTQ